MNLVRMILEYVEEKHSGPHSVPLPEFSDYRNCVVEYHVMLCAEAGYIEIIADGQSPKSIRRMKWAGHEKLDEMRTAGARSCATPVG